MTQFLNNVMGRVKEPSPAEDRTVRGLSLMEGEQVHECFASSQGLVGGAPKKGPLLLITNLRVISFLRGGDVKETYLSPIDELKSVVIKGKSRGIRNLVQGILFTLAGILAYFIIGYIRESTWSEISIASVVGIVVVLLGAFYFAKHLLWQPEGEIVFQGGTWERSSPDSRGNVESYRWQMSFPYRSEKANDEVYTLVNRFFEIRNLNGHAVSEDLNLDSQAVLADRPDSLSPRFVFSEDSGALAFLGPEAWRLYIYGSESGGTVAGALETGGEAAEPPAPWRQYAYGSS